MPEIKFNQLPFWQPVDTGYTEIEASPKEHLYPFIPIPNFVEQILDGAESAKEEASVNLLVLTEEGGNVDFSQAALKFLNLRR